MNADFDRYVENAIHWAKAKVGLEQYPFRCLAFVEEAYEESNNVEIFGCSTAKESAEEFGAKNNIGYPAIGSFVFYDAFGSIDNEYKNYGHVGLHIGNGNIVHTWDKIRIDNYLEVQDLISAPGWTKPKFIGWVPVERIFNGYIKK